MTLKTRIILVSMISVLTVSIFQIAISWTSQSEVEERFEKATITGKSTLWRKIVASQLDQMEAGTKSLTRDRDSLKALRAGDTAALRRLRGRLVLRFYPWDCCLPP